MPSRSASITISLGVRKRSRLEQEQPRQPHRLDLGFGPCSAVGDQFEIGIVREAENAADDLGAGKADHVGEQFVEEAILLDSRRRPGRTALANRSFG